MKESFALCLPPSAFLQDHVSASSRASDSAFLFDRETGRGCFSGDNLEKINVKLVSYLKVTCLICKISKYQCIILSDKMIKNKHYIKSQEMPDCASHLKLVCLVCMVTT